MVVVSDDLLILNAVRIVVFLWNQLLLLCFCYLKSRSRNEIFGQCIGDLPFWHFTVDKELEKFRGNHSKIIFMSFPVFNWNDYLVAIGHDFLGGDVGIGLLQMGD